MKRQIVFSLKSLFYALSNLFRLYLSCQLKKNARNKFSSLINGFLVRGHKQILISRFLPTSSTLYRRDNQLRVKKPRHFLEDTLVLKQSSLFVYCMIYLTS